jgi:hypothetical protein
MSEITIRQKRNTSIPAECAIICHVNALNPAFTVAAIAICAAYSITKTAQNPIIIAISTAAAAIIVIANSIIIADFAIISAIRVFGSFPGLFPN